MEGIMKLPEPNQIVVATNNHGKEMIVKFLLLSDGDYFWDNCKDEVWQSYEVVSWAPTKL
jgi:hypothetical protein